MNIKIGCPGCDGKNLEFLNEHPTSRGSKTLFSYRCKDCGRRFTV